MPIHFRKLLFPITPLLLLAYGLGILALVTLFKSFTSPSGYGIYPAVFLALWLMVLLLLALERKVLMRLPYLTVFGGELLILLFGYLGFSFWNRVTEIRFDTPQDYILVIFDARDTSDIAVKREGSFFYRVVWSKASVIHITPEMGRQNNLRITPPPDWGSMQYFEGKVLSNGDSVGYILGVQEIMNPKDPALNFRRSSAAYRDSLLRDALGASIK